MGGQCRGSGGLGGLYRYGCFRWWKVGGLGRVGWAGLRGLD